MTALVVTRTPVPKDNFIQGNGEETKRPFNNLDMYGTIDRQHGLVVRWLPHIRATHVHLRNAQWQHTSTNASSKPVSVWDARTEERMWSGNGGSGGGGTLAWWAKGERVMFGGAEGAMRVGTRGRWWERTTNSCKSGEVGDLQWEDGGKGGDGGGGVWWG